jgi:cysteinyl-tRNA synthetase
LNDINTPRALAEWGNSFKALKQESTPQGIESGLRLILNQAWLLGMDLNVAVHYLKTLVETASEDSHQLIGIEAEQVETLAARLEARRFAKQAKDFATSDAIRKDLESEGYTLIDRAGGWMTLERKSF